MSRRNVVPAVIIGVVLVVGALIAIPMSHRHSRPLGISFGLIDITSGSDCSGGEGGYRDIAPGMPITVKNQDGKILASTTLPEKGTTMPLNGRSGGCVWSVVVQVPGDQDQYAVEAGRRGDVTYSHAQLDQEKWRVGVTVGG